MYCCCYAFSKVFQEKISGSSCMILGPRSHCSVFFMMRFCCIKATRSHYYSVFVQKRKGKHPFSCVHIDLPDNKYGAKDIRFCAFTLFQFCEAHCWILQRFQKPLFLCVHIDQMRFRKHPFLWSFCADQCENFHKNGRFSLRFCTKTEQCERGLG